MCLVFACRVPYKLRKGVDAPGTGGYYVTLHTKWHQDAPCLQTLLRWSWSSLPAELDLRRVGVCFTPGLLLFLFLMPLLLLPLPQVMGAFAAFVGPWFLRLGNVNMSQAILDLCGVPQDARSTVSQTVCALGMGPFAFSLPPRECIAECTLAVTSSALGGGLLVRGGVSPNRALSVSVRALASCVFISHGSDDDV